MYSVTTDTTQQNKSSYAEYLMLTSVMLYTHYMSGVDLKQNVW